MLVCDLVVFRLVHLNDYGDVVDVGIVVVVGVGYMKDVYCS